MYSMLVSAKVFFTRRCSSSLLARDAPLLSGDDGWFAFAPGCDGSEVAETTADAKAGLGILAGLPTEHSECPGSLVSCR